MQTAADFSTITELAGDEVTRQQVASACHRYYWAAAYCEEKDVLEVACGSGFGLGYLAQRARTIYAGDINPTLVARVTAHYGRRVPTQVIDAQALPFGDNSLDVIVIFEALYYLPDPSAFVAECRRVLRSGGYVLVTNSNKDMPDFNPSPYSHTYHGVQELGRLFDPDAFTTTFFGYWTYEAAPLWQRALVPVKRAVVGLNLMPKTMNGKKFLKRIVFGSLVRMPIEISEGMIEYERAVPIPAGVPDRRHRVVYCAAQRH
ncbi:class I SAM-dependent methyltransferase [Bradyrhizobium sp. WSM1417]|uniref:class I SAM-dependent methyltransferase n=1 Tax=Bradyrhizobium sp. WSM1417 TaxID=754500 RepID=UPI0006867295|nr:class I SAM-dependent methyltransferase [Bradyrhizobium sp. WSM1417]